MSIQIVKSFGRCVLLLTTLLGSCDPFQEDFIPKEHQLAINKNATDYYILKNTPAIIDLKAIVTSLFTTVSMKVSGNPTRGRLTFLSEFLFKYTPAPSFMEGDDQFSVVFTTSKIVLTATVTVHMTEETSAFPCSLYAVEDYTHARPGAPVSTRVLDNDRICGIRAGDVRVSISIPPEHGQAVISGDSILYTSDPDFEGSDEIVYRIVTDNKHRTTAGDSLLVSHGLVKLTVTHGTCPFFIVDSLVLDMTDNMEDMLNAGECMGGYDLPVWGIITPPCHHYGYYTRQISQSNQSGSFCFGTDGGFAYYPDPDKRPKNELAKFEVCVNGQCVRVTIYIIREESG